MTTHAELTEHIEAWTAEADRLERLDPHRGPRAKGIQKLRTYIEKLRRQRDDAAAREEAT